MTPADRLIALFTTAALAGASWAAAALARDGAALGYCGDSVRKGWNFYCDPAQHAEDAGEAPAPAASPPPPSAPPPKTYAEQIETFRKEMDALKYRGGINVTRPQAYHVYT